MHLLIAVLSALSTLAEGPPKTSLVPDPSFERSGEGKLAVPTGWGLRPKDKAALRIAYDRAFKSHGEWSLKLDGARNQDHLLCWPKVAHGRRYLFSIDFAPRPDRKGIDLEKVLRAKFWYYGANRSGYGKNRKIEPIQPAGWHRMTMAFTPGWGTTHGALSIEIDPAYSDTVWLDNISLQALEKEEVVRQAPYPQRELEAKARSLDDALKVVEELLKIAGHLHSTGERRLLTECIGILEKHERSVEARNHAGQCGLFLEALDCFENRGYVAWTEQTGLGRYDSMRKAISLMGKIPAASPLYDKASFFIGRIKFGVALESARRDKLEEARDHLRPLLKKYPTHEISRMILGEKIPWGESYREIAKGAPVWAARQFMALNRVRDVILWWIQHRQAPTGEMGGGWGDDCEMLRHWGDAYFLTGDRRILDAAAQLADGIVREIAPRGYLDEIGDAEHAAEPTSDTAFLAGFDYGNPLHIERAMATARLMRDVWTGVNRFGHRHFRSCWFGARGVRPELPYAQDIPLNFRAIKPVLWLAWYNRNPEVIKLLRELGDAWVEDTRRTDGGKPAGLLPSAIVSETEEIGGFSGKWWYDGFYYSRWPAYHTEGYMALAGIASVTGDAKYLFPMQWTLERMAEFRGEGAGKLSKNREGSAEWAISKLRWRSIALPAANWRVETGNKSFDREIRGMGNSWAAWQIAGANAIHHLDYGFNQLEESVNFNFPMLTSEVISTDRVAVRNSGILFSLATGGSSSIWSPSYHITWRNTDARLAALVTGASETELKVSLFSFAEGTLKLQALFWRLLPGRYEWRVASSDNGDSISQGKFELKERGQNLDLSLPSRKSLVLTVEQKTKAGSPRLSGMADLAVSSRDLEVLRGEERSILRATVHNIGSAEARNVRVLVTADDGSEVMNEKLDQLPPPHALQPSVRQFTKSVKLGNAERLGLRVSSETPEICSTNNQTEARLPSIIVDPEFNRLFLVGETPGRNVHDLFWKAVQSWRELKKGRIDPTSLNVLLAAIEVQLLARDSPEDEKRLAEWQKYFSQALNSVPPIDTKTPVFTIELESIETHSLCRVVDDPAASGGKAMTYTSNNAWIEIGLALPAGRYRIRVLGKGTASTSDAIFITVDGKGRQRTYFPLDRFAWKDAVFGSERPGRRRIRILHAEPEVLLDRLEIYRR